MINSRLSRTLISANDETRKIADALVSQLALNWAIAHSAECMVNTYRERGDKRDIQATLGKSEDASQQNLNPINPTILRKHIYSDLLLFLSFCLKWDKEMMENRQ